MAIWSLAWIIFSSIWAQIPKLTITLTSIKTLYCFLQCPSTSVMPTFYISGTRYQYYFLFCVIILYLFIYYFFFTDGQYSKAREGSVRKFEAQKEFVEVMAHRMHVDSSIKLVGKLLFGIEKGHEVLKTVRPLGEPLVDDWDCLKTFVSILPYTWS